MKEKNPFNLDVVSVRLVKDAPIMSGHPITNPEDAVLLLGKHLCEMDREVLCVINMKTDGTPINCHFASIGCLNESMAHPREIFKASILSNAATIMLMHNHPSGNLTMGIPLLDHVIVGGDNRQYFSFKEKKLLDTPKVFLETNYQSLDLSSGLVAEQGKAR